MNTSLIKGPKKTGATNVKFGTGYSKKIILGNVYVFRLKLGNYE